jgi:hypothetical protein
VVDTFETSIALAGLEGELRLLRERVNAILRSIQLVDREVQELNNTLMSQESLAAQLCEALGEYMPPVKPGQRTKVRANGGTFIVDAVERAFGQWLCLGHFPQGDKKYTYPVSELEYK